MNQKTLFPPLLASVPYDMKVIKRFVPLNLYNYIKNNYKQIIDDCVLIFEADTSDDFQVYQIYKYFEHIAPNYFNGFFNMLCNAQITIKDEIITLYDRSSGYSSHVTGFLMTAFFDFFEYIVLSKNYKSYQDRLLNGFFRKHMVFIAKPKE